MVLWRQITKKCVNNIVSLTVLVHYFVNEAILESLHVLQSTAIFVHSTNTLHWWCLKHFKLLLPSSKKLSSQWVINVSPYCASPFSGPSSSASGSCWKCGSVSLKIFPCTDKWCRVQSLVSSACTQLIRHLPSFISPISVTVLPLQWYINHVLQHK